MTPRFDLPSVLACLAVLFAVPAAQAQGTVAWSQGYPQGVNTVGPPMTQAGKILFKGTQTPAAGWSFAMASANIIDNAGGGSYQPTSLGEKNGDLGGIDPNTGNITEYTVNNVPKGQYTVWIEVRHRRPLPGGPPGAIQVATSNSPVPPAVVIK